MGIYDRDYYRDSSRGFHPFDSRIQACVCLALTYIAFVLVVAGTRQYGDGLHGPVYEALDLQASKVLDGEVWRLATYAFLHNAYDYWSIIVNVVFLFWIGRHVEDIYGWKEFLAYYLFSGLLAGVAFVAISAIGGQAKNVQPAVGVWAGPGGSITAVLFLFALHYPTRKFFYYIPVWVVVGLYFFVNVFNATTGMTTLGVLAAHAAAASFALLYYQYSLRVSNWLPGLPSRGSSP